jgi:glycosyltransferase involved in cell wall biosynthesis
MEKKAVLSIGMIFKNEIRCLERCLESLLPLRETIPCELVMADTGSSDGSREVAERYADTLIPFPWVNDFSAARNAVMDRCSGKWFLSIDTDEWLDGDVSELAGFLRSDAQGLDGGTVIIRNYATRELFGDYSDFAALRLVRLSADVRFEGAIHESLIAKSSSSLTVKALRKTLLHHDGYADLGRGHTREKRERNIQILRRELAEAPDDLRRLLQYLESGLDEPDYPDQIRRACALVEKKAQGWEVYGPPIFRLAVSAAVKLELPETDSWIKQADEWFPDSYYTRVDVAERAFSDAWNRKKDYAQSIVWGERYLTACADYAASQNLSFTLVGGPLTRILPVNQQMVCIFLASAYLEERQPEKALTLLGTVDGTLLDEAMMGFLTGAIAKLQNQSSLDTGVLVQAIWDKLSLPIPSPEKAALRQDLFQKQGYQTLSDIYRREELETTGFCRPAYTAFLPLEDRCGLGRSAAVLAAKTPELLEEKMAAVQNWGETPFDVLIDALKRGGAFPRPEIPLNAEELDGFAAKLAREPDTLYHIFLRAASNDCAGNWQTLAWAQALALTAVQVFDWESGGEMGMDLARSFAKVEGTFLTGCYAPEVLLDENLRILPPLHRFGWRCAQAFNALDSGDAAGYVQMLRAGLETAPGVQPMVEYLTEHTPALQVPPPPPELLALAEQVRTILSAYGPESPAVQAVKESPAYQRVAYLLEGDSK